MKRDGVRCPICTYCVDGLPTLRCPECGEAVDDASREDAIERRIMRRVTILTLLLLLSFPATLYFAWFSGWIALGHAPEPIADDPDRIHGITAALVFIAKISLLGFVLGFLLSSILPAIAIVRRDSNWWRYLGLIILGVLVASPFHHDPGQVMKWFWD